MPRVSLFLLGASLAFLSGCASSGSYSLVVPTAGGERVRVPLGKGGVTPFENNEVQIEAPAFTLNPDERQLIYLFAITDKRGAGFKHVRIDDVSGEQPQLVLDEAAPELKENRWVAASPPINMDDPRLKWLTTIDNSARVFRFSLTLRDDRTVTYHQGTFFPAAVKSAIRRTFGMNY